MKMEIVWFVIGFVGVTQNIKMKYEEKDESEKKGIE